jgi:Chaperone of endosialidase
LLILLLPNSTQDNLINSVAYQNANKIGLNTKSPKYLLDVKGDSINIGASSLTNGYRISSLLVASASSSLKTIYLGDAAALNIINLFSLIIAGLIPASPTTKTRILGIDDSGLVKVVTMPTAGSVLFSDGTTIASDPAHFFWDSTNNRLGILTNTPAYSLDVNGTLRASTSLITPVIGNTAGITANNTWTYTSNINVPVTPIDATHAASKQYVDNTALTGLKLGAAVKTVATSNVGLSGLSAINGYTPIAGDRILVIGQTTATQNGVYDAALGGWTRSTDSDTDAKLRGYQYLITAGTYINARYGNTNQSAITIGTTNITYQQISNAEIDPIFTASPSFGITGTNISNWNTAYDRSPITLAVSGTTTKTITLTKQSGTTLTASFTDTVTSVFGRTGDVTLLPSDVTTALTYTPYNSTNPSGYTNNTGTVTSVGGTGTVSGLTLTGTVTTSGNLTLGGAISLTPTNIIVGLGYTPYDAANLVGYITAAQARAAISLTTMGTSGAATYSSSTGVLNIPQYQGGVTSIVAGTNVSISGGTGAVTINAAGSVTSVAATSSIGLTITNSPITTSGTLVIGSISDDLRMRSLRVGSFTGLTLPSAVDGKVEASGDIVGFSTSDERLKENIKIIENATDKLSRIRGVKFDWKKEFEYLHGFEGSDIGVIAQDVEVEFPEAIKQRETGYLAVRYEKLIGLLIAGFNEQSKKIKELESKIK